MIDAKAAMDDGGEACRAECAEQPFDVAFAPTTHVFAVGLINGDVEQWSHTQSSCAKLDRGRADWRLRRRGQRTGSLPDTKCSYIF